MVIRLIYPIALAYFLTALTFPIRSRIFEDHTSVGGILCFLLVFSFNIWFVLSPYGLAYVFHLIDKVIPVEPRCPRCESGKCKHKDYTVSLSSGGYIYNPLRNVYMPRKTYLVFTCRCGFQYVMRGNDFMKKDADGNEIPYMKYRAFYGWVHDRK